MKAVRARGGPWYRIGHRDVKLGSTEQTHWTAYFLYSIDKVLLPLGNSFHNLFKTHLRALRKA